MKNLIKLSTAILFFALIYSCEKEEFRTTITITIPESGRVDTIVTDIPEIPLISMEATAINDTCKLITLYQNLDDDPSYNEGSDHLIGRYTVSNEKAKDHEFAYEIYDINELCNRYVFYIDGIEELNYVVCDGPTGWITEYDTIVQIKAYFIYDTTREIISQIDTIIIIKHDSIVQIDTIFKLDTLVLIDSVLIFRKDSIIKIDSVFIIDKDTSHFLKETIIIPGPIKFWPCDTIWSGSLFSPGFSISNMEFIGGNKKGATLQVFGKDNFENISLLFDFYWDPVPEFDWTDPTTYIRSFNNEVDTSLNFSSMGVLVKYSAPAELLCKEDYVYLMNIRITAIKEE